MKQIYYIFIILAFAQNVSSQVSYEILAPMPERVSNNAISSVEINGNWYVYSFSGIDAMKQYSGIHAKTFKYDVTNDVWTELAPLPSLQDRIAAGASTVRGKIYILGGYEVLANGSEISINNLHVFDPSTDEFLMDATPIPTPIDDQVQLVYKDSLIYSITGWSNNGNVADVWIYDVVQKEWKAGTSTPTTPAFKAFGASGSIVGDTIYYIGGAFDTGNFGPNNRLRKGFINPIDPTDITWEISTSDHAIDYRAGSGTFEGKAIWLGGSQNTYNYNGIAYNGAGGVPATSRLVFYDPEVGALQEFTADFPPIMDLRGLAQIGPNTYITAGGMKEDQKVTDRVVKYQISTLVNTLEYRNRLNFSISPNPNRGVFTIEIDNELASFVNKYLIYDALGKIVYSSDIDGVNSHYLDLDLDSGIYVLSLKIDGGMSLSETFVIK